LLKCGYGRFNVCL